jgi:hypothetical protein
MKKSIFAGAAALVLVGTMAAGSADARPWHRHGGWGHHHGGGWGPALGGFAAGALIGSALAPRPAYPAYGAAPYPPSGEIAYCQQRFKSYDPASGTYLGYDGDRHPCP